MTENGKQQTWDVNHKRESKMQETRAPMRTYKEVRTIDIDMLRGLCIRMGWYTRGSGISYYAMLSAAAVKDNLATSDIIGIALDIAQHSDLSDMEPGTDILASIAHEVARAAYTRFVPEEEEDK